MINQAFIQVKNLSVWYDTTQALQRITLDFGVRLTALLGPTGSGKTTLLQAMNGMLRTRHDARMEGDVLLSDMSLQKLHEKEVRKRIGYVMGTPTLFPMSIYENVAYGPRIHGLHDAKTLDHIVETCLRNVGLLDEGVIDLRRNLDSLSPVEQQLLCIARALALDPEVLLLDEPTKTLRGEDVFRVERLIEKLKEKRTLVVATADPQQAGRVSECTAFLLGGQLIECSPTREFFFRPKDKRTEEYFASHYSG